MQDRSPPLWSSQISRIGARNGFLLLNGLQEREIIIKRLTCNVIGCREKEKLELMNPEPRFSKE
jgi:hypothetical protein